MNKSEKSIKFNKFLKSIGGLENGFKFVPYYWSSFRFFDLRPAYYFKNHLFYLFEFFQLIGLKDRRNPFRSKIKDRSFCSCGDGWLPLIQECIEGAIKLGWNKEICQIKEKFGGLRFYTNSASEECHAWVSKCGARSYEICEQCGSTDNVSQTKGGWITSLCKQCINKEKV